MKKRLLSLALTLAMLLSTITVVGITASAEMPVAETTVIANPDYRISSYEDLVAFATACKDNPGLTAVLTANITANSASSFNALTATSAPANVWTAIEAFNGKFDGQGHTIEGLYTSFGFINKINDGAVVQNVTFKNCYTTAQVEGLDIAGTVASLATGTIAIYNVHVIDSLVTAVSDSENTKVVGGLIGDATYGSATSVTFESCSMSGKVGSPDVTSTGNYRVGGLMGRINSTKNLTVKYFANYATTVGTQYVGGVLGETGSSVTFDFDHVANYGTVTSKAIAGGLIALHSATGNQTYNWIENTAEVKSTGNQAGGFFGKLAGSGAVISIEDASNSGKVTSTNRAGGIGSADGPKSISLARVVNSGYVSGSAYTGGFFGDLICSTSASFTDCVNSGEIVSASLIGGFVGYMKNTPTINITNCTNSGTVTCTASQYAGGFAGKCEAAARTWNFDGFVNSGAITSNARAGGFIGAQEGSDTSKGIINISNSVNSATISGKSFAAGMVAEAKYQTFNLDNCANFGTVAANGNVGGGLIGYSANAVVGTSGYAAVVKNSYNAGNVSGTTHLGGVIGLVNAAVYMENCMNVGEIVSSGGNSRVGGLVGDNQNGANGIYKYCISTGKVQSTADVAAGIVGDIGFSSVSDSTASNFTYVTFEECYFTAGMVYNGANQHKNYMFCISNMASAGAKRGNVKLIYNGVSTDLIGGVVNETTSWSSAVVAYNQTIIDGVLPACLSNKALVSGVDGAIALTRKGFDFGSAWHVTDALPVPTVLALEKGTIDQTTPVVYKGYQMKLDGTSIRLVAGLNDVAYVNMGYEIKVLEKGAVKAPATAPETTTVYTQLNAFASEDDANPDSIKAEDLDCAYLSAVSINNFPAETDATIIVTPYVTNADDSKTYGTSIALIIVDGVVTFQYVIWGG